MSDRKVVVFETRNVDAEERLIREYIVPAFRRLEDRDDIQWLMFNRYGHDPSVDGGEVLFSIFGDVEAVAADERDRWNALLTDGFAEDWWTDDTTVRIDAFDDAERLHHRLRAAASRMSVTFFEEFDELPSAIDEFEGDGSISRIESCGVGWWICLHYLINQLGYQANGGEEEIDLLFEDLRNRLYSLTSCFGPARAETKIEALVGTLEALPVDLRQAWEEYGEHEHRYANREAFDDG